MSQSSTPPTGHGAAEDLDIGGSAAVGAGDDPAAKTAQGSGTAPADQASARVAELEDRWRRAVAELDNAGKRYARDLDRRIAEERARVVAAWLPVLDGLEMALQHAESDPATIVPGVQAVRDQSLSVLQRLGFTRQGEAGAVFDPARHEAVSTVRTDQFPPGTVAQVLRPGYGSTDQLLRPAMVVVAAEAGDG